jgi:hypothetical protein
MLCIRTSPISFNRHPLIRRRKYTTKSKKRRIRYSKPHNELSTEGWSHSQKSYFERFGASETVGARGLNKFQTSFSEHSGVPTAVINELNAQASNINQLLSNTNNVLSSLGGLANIEKSAEGQGIVQSSLRKRPHRESHGPL